jgi:O-antigen/teichoic acid export membrane protein
MSVKKNFGYNSILLLSQYLIPLIVFPYVSRVFGVENVGLVNFADSTVNYFVLLSTLGLTITGIRETAKNRNNPEELSKVFSELLFLHIIITFIVLCIYVGSVYFFDKFSSHRNLYLIGASKLIFNVFLIEWFFRGIENFKFIVIRSVLIKALYVGLLFIFVDNREDLEIYFVLTCGTVVVNGLVNCWYSQRYVSLVFDKLNFKRHFKAFYTIGIYMILTSMYTTFNVVYLGFVSSDLSVGYYTTALKLYVIILGLFSALNMVLVPRLSSLMANEEHAAFNNLIHKSISFVSIFCFPVIMCGLVLAPQIIYLLAGSGYGGAVVCFRLILPLIFIVGLAQILSNQILMSFKRDKDLAITSFVGAIIGVILNIVLVPLYNEIGTSFVVLISEIIVTFILYFFCRKHADFTLPYKIVFYNFIVSLPYLLVCYLCVVNLSNILLILICASFFSCIYFVLSQVFILKNEIIVVQFEKLFLVKNILKDK